MHISAHNKCWQLLQVFLISLFIASRSVKIPWIKKYILQQVSNSWMNLKFFVSLWPVSLVSVRLHNFIFILSVSHDNEFYFNNIIDNILFGLRCFFRPIDVRIMVHKNSVARNFFIVFLNFVYLSFIIFSIHWNKLYYHQLLSTPIILWTGFVEIMSSNIW